MTDRWGEEGAERLERGIAQDPEVARWGEPSEARDEATAKVSYRYVPAPLFLDYVEAAIPALVMKRLAVAEETLAEDVGDPIGQAVGHLNGLFARRGINYRFDDGGRAEWHGDEGAYREVIAPALAALDDPRLAAARDEFTAALRHLRAGTKEDEEDAIVDAAKAVESMMKVVLSDRSIARTGNEAAEALWNLLRENEIVPPKTKDAILAASRLRNEYGGHGAGEAPRQIPDGITALTVHAAAGAIVYLASVSMS